MSTSAERTAVLEAEMKQVLATQKQNREDILQINEKLDELLALRHKGVGAFWVASSLLGTGIVGMILTFIDWLKHG